MKYTKAQLEQVVYMILRNTLHSMECEKVKKEGNWDCDRCDECMLEQYLKKAKEISYIGKDNKIHCNVCDEVIEHGYCTCERSIG